MPDHDHPNPRPALFEAGLIVHSHAAFDALEKAHGHERAAGEMPGARYVERHLSGDFGEAGEQVRQANLSAIESGYRIFSSYELPTGDDLWIVTEAETSIGYRPRTSLLLATEASAPARKEPPR